MLEDILKPFNCSLSLQRKLPTLFIARITCKSIDLDQEFKWVSTPIALQAVIQLNVNKLLSVLSSGVRFSEENYDELILKDFIDSHKVNLSPDLKLDAVLEYVSSRTTFDGQSVELKNVTQIDIVKMNFNNSQEWTFYLQNAVAEMYLKKTTHSRSDTNLSYDKYALTVKGLTRLIRINEGRNSNSCFVAMAFEDDIFEIAEDAIKPALNSFGFSYVSVSEQHIDSDKTINDAILVGIKKAKFTIADFTHQRRGVYFEAGYALGRGQKVIYCCKEDHIDLAHFDIRNYQHIVWKDAQDFRKKLVDKIGAFIID